MVISQVPPLSPRKVPYPPSHPPPKPLQYEETGPQPCPFALCHAPAFRLGEVRGGLPPLTGVWGCPPDSPKTPLGRAGGKNDAHVTATTSTSPTRTGPRLDNASALPRGQSKTFRLGRRSGPTVNQAVANNLESGKSPQKTFSSNDQTIKTRPFPGCGTERRPAPTSRGDAGHDIVSRPISRVLYPPERTVAISLGWRLPATSSDQPEDWAGRPIVLLFGLAPGGVCPAGRSPDRW
jgi:hypothetical protein